MTYTGPVFRPPFEANSLLLEASVGCSHNRCSFCSMYEGVRFKVAKIEQIRADLKEAKELYGTDIARVFLTGGDPFVLSFKQLEKNSHKH